MVLSVVVIRQVYYYVRVSRTYNNADILFMVAELPDCADCVPHVPPAEMSGPHESVMRT